MEIEFTKMHRVLTAVILSYRIGNGRVTNKESEYLPQRRKGAKYDVNNFENFAFWRLGAIKVF